MMLPSNKYIVFAIFAILIGKTAFSQTDQDGLMMNKNLFCTGIIYNTSSWNKYWEGTNKRENLNLGTVSSNSINLMGNYGIKDNLNFLFNVPYVSNNVIRLRINIDILGKKNKDSEGSIYTYMHEFVSDCSLELLVSTLFMRRTIIRRLDANIRVID